MTPVRIIGVAALAAFLLGACSRDEAPDTAAPLAGPAKSVACERIAPDQEQTVTTDSGLKYADSKVCPEAALAQSGDFVTVHYSGYLYDDLADAGRGDKFDSSVDRGQPFQFTLGQRQVIRGWDEGVAGMTVGGKRRLTIPYDLAYGERGRPPVIPPSATLVFDVELLGVESAAQQ